jgi:hypothetical protein
MEFMHSPPDIVRSRNQRCLLDYWHGLREHDSLPVWGGLPADGLAISDVDLSYTTVVGKDGARRFRIEFHGTRVAEAYGRVSCVGKFLDEILPAAFSATALSTYHQVVNGRQPIYTVSDMRDPGGRIVHYERLLLPFSLGGSEVERILASLETSSPEGAFEHRSLMTSPARPPAFALCATIQY